MEILSFTISGKMAHFRKYYANNTAFSFSIPPRTTLMGIVAAAMGWQKDSYYDKLSSENIQFGVRVLHPLKKSFQRLNFLKIINISDFRGRKGRIQTPFEVISPWDLRKGNVEYQVFLTPTETGKAVFKKIKEHFLTGKPVYNITLGTANFSAQIKNCRLFTENEIQQKKTDDFVLIHSAVPIDLVKELNFDKENQDAYNFVEEDMLPGDFIGNNNREVRKMNQLLFSTTSQPLRVKLNSEFLELNKNNQRINIQFMDV